MATAYYSDIIERRMESHSCAATKSVCENQNTYIISQMCCNNSNLCNANLHPVLNSGEKMTDSYSSSVIMIVFPSHFE